MTFTELLNEVYTLTNRPDLVAETKVAVKAATLKAHQSDYYSKDLIEVGISFDSPEYIQSFDYRSFIFNYRSLKYLRRVVDENDTEGKFLEILTPEEILDSYGCSRKDIAYIAGRVLEIRSSIPLHKALLGAYVNPNIIETKYDSWVAEQFPYAIVFEAARVVFKTIGYDEQSASFERLVAEQFRLLNVTALSDVGS